MGLRAQFTMDDLGYAECTEEMGVYIDYSEGCDIFVDVFLSVATDLVPVDTGYLRSTLEAHSYGDECICETLCEYAQYVEYGTVYQHAQPYFEPALDAALAEAIPRWDAAVELAMAEEQALIEEIEAAEAARQQSGVGRLGNMVTGRGGMMMGGGSLVGMILGAIVAGIIIGLINVVKDMFNGGRSSGGGRGGGGDLFGFANSIEVEII